MAKLGRPKGSKNRKTVPGPPAPPFDYFGFRLAHDASGKWRTWMRQDEFYGTFNHADDDAKLQALREACVQLSIPVYYFGDSDDYVEQAERLILSDPLPKR